MFLNSTGSLGVLFQYFTINITGSELLSIISILVFVLTIALMFKMPIELIMIIIVPMLLVFMAYYSGFMIYGGIALIILAIIFALNYFIK